MRCEGFHKLGNLWTVGGVPVWEQCKNEAVVMLTVVQDGEKQTLPACRDCWQESVENTLIEVIAVESLEVSDGL